jgi:formylmethanofuran dehydrogenase subunit E
VQEMKSQSMLIRERFQRHQNSSSTKMLNELTKLIKDVSIMMHRTILISNQIASLQKTNIEASQRKSRKRKYIKNRLMLTMTEDANFVSLTDADVTNSSDEINDEVTTKKRSSKQKRCEKCENLEHNSRICQKDKETVSKSDTSSQQLMK